MTRFLIDGMGNHRKRMHIQPDTRTVGTHRRPPDLQLWLYRSECSPATGNPRPGGVLGDGHLRRQAVSMAWPWQDIEVQARRQHGHAARLGSERSGSARAWQWVGHIVVSKIDVVQFDVIWDPLGYGGIPAMHMFKDAELEPHLA